VSYTVKKDVNVNLTDGTDAGLTGTYDAGFTIPKGKTAEIITVITVYDASGNIYYADPQVTTV